MKKQRSHTISAASEKVHLWLFGLFCFGMLLVASCVTVNYIPVSDACQAAVEIGIRG